MEIVRRPRRPRPESIVPMINVVFLMLIFFLMTAAIAPPDPIEVEPPVAAAEPTADEGVALYLGPDATLAYQDLRGEAAVAAAFSQAKALEVPLHIRADKESPAVEVARLLSSVAKLGPMDVLLITAHE